MRVLFCYPDILDFPQYPGEYYFGIGYIAALLKKSGFEVSLIHLVKRGDTDHFIADIRKFSPNLIAFSFTSNMLYYVQQCIKLLNKELPSIPVIAGGVHPTLNPEETLLMDGIDMVCVGEGEYPLLDLCNSYKNKITRLDIENIWFKVNGAIKKNTIRTLLNLDTLPYADREVFPDYRNLLDERQGRISFMASRGWSYSCTYCCNTALRDTYQYGNYVRFRSVDNIIGEIKNAINRYDFVESIVFHDDILPLNMEWFERFAEEYKKEINLPYRCNLRPNLVNKKVVDLFKYSNCDYVSIGIESGNEFMRNKTLGRGINDRQLKSSFDFLKSKNIQVTSFNMVGMPFETKDMILETIKMNARLGADLVQSTIFFPYKGTQLFDLCMEHKLIKQDKVVTDYYTDTKIDNKFLKKYEIVAYKKSFNFLVPLYKYIYNRFGENRSAEKCLDSILKLPFILFLLYISSKVILFVLRSIRRGKYNV